MSLYQIVLCMAVGFIGYYVLRFVLWVWYEHHFRRLRREHREFVFSFRHEPRDNGYPTEKELESVFRNAVMKTEYRTLCKGGVEDRDRERDREFFERLHETP